MSQTENINFGYLGSEFQKKLFWQIFTDNEFGNKMVPYLETSYFDDASLKRLFQMTKKYYNEYARVPNLGNKSVATLVSKYKDPNNQIEAKVLETLIVQLETWDIAVASNKINNDGDVIQNETLVFVKQQEFIKLANEITKYVSDGSIKDKSSIYKIEERIRKINEIGIEETNGVEVFDNIEDVLTPNYRNPIPTGVSIIDESTKGGLGGGEMGIILAGTGIGKSTLLTAIANGAYNQNKNVLQIIFEDNPKDIQRKHYCLWSGVSLEIIDSDENVPYVIERVKKKQEESSGILRIEKFSEEDTTVPKLREFIDNYQKLHGIYFDIVVLDYIDCLESHKKAAGKNDLLADELVIVKAIQSMGSDYNVPIWTAIQANREGLNTDFIDTSQMSGNIKRAQKTNFLMSISKSPEQKRHGLANAAILKSRIGGDGKIWEDTIFDNATMRVLETGNRGATSKILEEAKELPNTDSNPNTDGNLGDIGSVIDNL